jgi:hypothetical protein
MCVGYSYVGYERYNYVLVLWISFYSNKVGPVCLFLDFRIRIYKFQSVILVMLTLLFLILLLTIFGIQILYVVLHNNYILTKSHPH